MILVTSYKLEQDFRNTKILRYEMFIYDSLSGTWTDFVNSDQDGDQILFVSYVKMTAGGRLHPVAGMSWNHTWSHCTVLFRIVEYT